MQKLSKAERAEIREKLDLTKFGFEKIDHTTYRSDQYFNVGLFEWCVMFSSKNHTRIVPYDKIKAFLKDIKNANKNTMRQGNKGS